MASPAGSTQGLACQCTYGQTCLGCPAGQYGPSSPHEVATLGVNGGSSFQPNDINMQYPLPGKLGVLANWGNGRVMYVNFSSGEVTEINSGGHGYADGVASVAKFYDPSAATASPDGSIILVAGNTDHRVRQIDVFSGNVTTLSGDGEGGGRDGNLTYARYYNPQGIAFHPGGSRVYISEYAGRIRLLDLEKDHVSTIYDGGAVNKMTITNDGNALIFSSGNQIKAMELASYSVRTVAGNAQSGYADGQGDSARFNRPTGLAVDSTDRTVFVADTDNSRIRSVDIATGRVATLAGGSGGYKDGLGTSAQFQSCWGITITPDDSMLLIADTGNNR